MLAIFEQGAHPTQVVVLFVSLKVNHHLVRVLTVPGRLDIRQGVLIAEENEQVAQHFQIVPPAGPD